MANKKDKEDNYCIYRHLKPNGEVFYIGIGNKERPYKKQNRSKFWKDAVSKYGYEIQILKSNLTWKEAIELEIVLISWYKRRDCCNGTLVNLTNGGEGIVGKIFSEESKKKMSDSHKGRFIGENNPSYGKPKSDETKKKISESRMGIKWSEEQRIKVAEYHKNNPMSQEVKNKISESTKRCKSSSAKEVINTETLEIYCCVEDVSDLLSVPKTTLTSWLNGTYKNKSVFIYLENYYEGIVIEPFKKLSIYKYISYDKKQRRWFSNYRINNMRIIKDSFKTEEEAYKAMISHPMYEKG